MATAKNITFGRLHLKQQETMAFYGKSKVIATVFPRNDTNPYTKAEVHKLITDFTARYAGKPITFMSSVDIPDLGWRSAKQFQTTGSISLSDDYVWEDTSQFVLYAWKTPEETGGANATNDCLWDCLAKVRFPMKEIPFAWRSAEKLKKQLGIKRKDPIPFSVLCNVEDGIHININCIGDFTHTSQNKYLRSMTIKLTEGHYTLVNDTDKKLISRVPHNSKVLFLYFVLQDGENMLCYDGDDITTTSLENLEQYKDYAVVKTDKRLLDKDTKAFIRYKTRLDLMREYGDYMLKVKQLYDATDGAIDLSKYEYNINTTAKVLAYQHFKTLPNPEEIDKVEEAWLLNSFKGGLIHGQNIELDNAREYDQKSAYPFHMVQPHIDFPMKKGVFEKLNELPEQLSYGIYRVQIFPSHDLNINKLFSFNSQNYYTHFDIKMARQLGLDISLINNTESNCLLYKTGRLKGCSMFKTLMDYLFDLKSKGIPFAKELINMIWGALCERRKCTRIARPAENKEIQIDDATIYSINPTENGHKFKYMKNDRPVFVYNYARLGVFLTSRVRLTMMSVMLPHKENIYRFHTDGFITDKELPEITLGEKIGNFEIKKQGHCKISNCMRVVWS